MKPTIAYTFQKSKEENYLDFEGATYFNKNNFPKTYYDSLDYFQGISMSWQKYFGKDVFLTQNEK